MPIKGLHRNRQTPGLARAGVIRLGYKARKCQNKNCGLVSEASLPACPRCKGASFGNEFPREAPHFVLTDAPGVADALGSAEPTELRIYFPFDEVDKVFPHFMQMWSASSLVCRGDGEQILHAINPQTGKAIVRDGRALEDFSEGRRAYEAGQLMPCPGLDRNLYPKCAYCKPNAILVVMLRDIPRLAYYQITTTSINNILDIPAQLDYVRRQVEKLTGQARLTGVPFILRRVKRSVSVPNLDKNGNPKKDKNGKLLPPKQRTEKFFLELEIEPEWIARMVRALARLSDPMGGAAGLLPAGPAAEIDAGAPPAASHFAEPPAWEPRDYEDSVIEGDSVEIEAEAESPADWWEDEPAPVSSDPPPVSAGRTGDPAPVKAARPLDAGQLVDFLKRRAGDDGQAASKAQVGLLDRKLEECFAGSGDERGQRLAVLEYVWQVGSAKELTAGQAKATLDWLLVGGPDDTGDYPLHPAAAEEARRLYREAQRAKGQLDMFEDAEVAFAIDLAAPPAGEGE